MKFFSIGMRLGHANVRLEESCSHWQAFIRVRSSHQPTDQDIVTANIFMKFHLFTTEETVAGIRHCADEFVATIWYLEKYVEDGTYPSTMKIDMIGEAVAKKQPESILANHQEFLDFLNRLSNALKHSFADSDSTLIGSDQPRVTAINFPRNRIRVNGPSPQLIDAPLGELVASFNEFLSTCFARLKELSDQIHAQVKKSCQ